MCLILFKERTCGHGGILGNAAVVALAAAAFTSEHGLGAGFVLLELQVLVDGEGMGHGLYVKVVGTDKREGPTLLLQLLNHRADHLQRPFLAAVLLAVGDDGHQHVVAVLNLGVSFGDSLANSIVERCTATWAVGFPVQILSLCSGQVVVMPGGVAAVEGKQGNILLLIGEFLLHLADSLQGLVHAYKGLFADNFHGTALIDNNQVVDSLSLNIIRLHNRNILNGEYFFFD